MIRVDVFCPLHRSVLDVNNAVPDGLNAIVTVRDWQRSDVDHLRPPALRLGINEPQDGQVAAYQPVQDLTLISDFADSCGVGSWIEIRASPAISKSHPLHRRHRSTDA